MLLVVLLLVASGLGAVMMRRIFQWIKDPRPTAAGVSAHVWRFAAIAVLAAACVVAYVREERATREAYLVPSGTKLAIELDILAGKTVDFRVFRINVKGEETPLDIEGTIVGDTENLSQADAAAKLGMSTGAIKVMIHRLRKDVRSAVEAEIAQTVPSPDDIAEELRYLVEVLG